MVAIHSEIPDEEQAEAFKMDQERRVVKVIVATNAAESSITVTMPCCFLCSSFFVHHLMCLTTKPHNECVLTLTPLKN